MTATQPTRRISSRTSVLQRLVRIWEFRELLVELVRKELKVKYKNSALGFIWSMLNPALYLVVFYVVFQLILKNGIPFFAFYMAIPGSATGAHIHIGQPSHRISAPLATH